MTNAPTPFEEYVPGALLHGTKASLAVGDLTRPNAPRTLRPTARRATCM